MNKSEEKVYKLMDLIQELSKDGAPGFSKTMFALRDFLETVYQEGYEDGVKNWAEKIGKN